MKKAIKKTEFFLCAVLIVFQLYTSYFGNLFGISQKAVHVGLIISIIALNSYLKADEKKLSFLIKPLSIFICIFGLFLAVYLTLMAKTLSTDMTTFTPVMKVVGVIFVLVLVYYCWTNVGPLMAAVVAFFVFYAFYGKIFPALLAHSGMKFDRFVHLICFTSEGIFGTPLNASATFIATFIILGSLFSVTGVGPYMCELANALLGSFRGGPAKVAVVSSALFGSISGSAVANVVGTGTFTIPLMKSVGYDSEFAGAVEATASTGGQIMPPVMGASAFLLAEFVGVKYWDVCVAAALPALLYYLAVIFQVDFYALSHGLHGVAKEDLPDLKKSLKGIWKLSPIVLLIILIGPLGFTVTRTGVCTITFTVLISFLSKDMRLNKERLKEFVSDAAHGCLTVAIATAAAGIIIGSVTGTGLSVRLSSVLVKLAGGNFVVLILLTMIASLILGMGLPTAACYLLLASLVAPAIIKLGAPVMAAHMFVLYFGVISNVTPPVAMAAYAGAGIAKCNPLKCGIKAFKLAVGGFLIPFFFIFNDVLLLNGGTLEVIQSAIMSIIGIYCISAFMEGWIWTAPLNWPGRVAIGVAGLLTIYPDTVTDLVGIALIAVVHLFYNIKYTKSGGRAAHFKTEDAIVSPAENK